EADKVPISLFVLSQHQKVVVLVVGDLRAMILRLANVEFAAQDWLDPLGLGRVKEMHRSVNVSVIVHGHCLLANPADPVYELVNVAGAVKKRIFGMQMEVSELGHGSF